MKKLTFTGFLRRYVKELSLCGSTDVLKLLQEAKKDNPRLYEPLFLYCYCSEKKELLEKCAEDPTLDEGLKTILRYSTPDEMVQALQKNAEDIPANYQKVWHSYQTARDRVIADNHTKSLMRSYIKELQGKHNISTYRIYKDLNLNPGNLNAWLKHGSSDKISLTNARRVINYLENVTQVQLDVTLPEKLRNVF